MEELNRDLRDLKLNFIKSIKQIRDKYCEDKSAIIFTVSDTYDESSFKFMIDINKLKINP
jgi:hypothetical protein